ncbi:MAG: hypothetical protein AAFU85_16410 [Planctomycetota bacterium]
MPETIVCPFCPLHCDDIIARDDGSFVSECELASEAFQAVNQPAQGRFGGESINSAELKTLSERLGFSRRPVVEFGLVSIEQAKRLYELKSRIVFKLRAADGTHSQTIERDGIDSATISDITKHADVVLAVGSFDSTPRLLDRLSSSRAQTHRVDAISATEIGALRNGESVESIPPEIWTSRYLAILIGESAFETGAEVACAESLHRFVRQRNGQAIDEQGHCRRAILVRFDPHQNLKTVFRWRGNESVDESLVPGMSNRWTTEIRLGSAYASSQDSVQPAVKLQIGGLDPGSDAAEAYLPAAAVGVHHRGTTIRGDGSVCLPLSDPASSGLDDPIELLRRVLP